MLSHSFDRFYVVAKFELPRVEDVKLTTVEFDSKCTYLSKGKKTQRGAILASVLGGIASSIIALAYEGISSFLHHKRHKALNKAVKVVERKTE